ncbi:MAG: voltage-gated potassium channel [Candidatus Latescibacterota bacterium]|jgi:voltage-gated potassium channel
MLTHRHHKPDRPWRARLHEVIFEAETPTGRWFDEVLIACIVASVLVVMFDSVKSYRDAWGDSFQILEWGFTFLFTVEYILRLMSVGRPLVYARSFFGVVDLLAILPTYVSLIFPGSHYFLVIRLLRVLRIFRVLKIVQYVGEANHLMQALRSSQRKITVFLFAVMTLAVIFGSIIYVVEDEKDGFTSIPRSVYWAIVTLTTVGYGDISPKTDLGQAIAAVIMIFGYGIIAVPTGIVSAEFAQLGRSTAPVSTQACPSCGCDGHDVDAVHCKLCGGKLGNET